MAYFELFTQLLFRPIWVSGGSQIRVWVSLQARQSFGGWSRSKPFSSDSPTPSAGSDLAEEFVPGQCSPRPSEVYNFHQKAPNPYFRASDAPKRVRALFFSNKMIMFCEPKMILTHLRSKFLVGKWRTENIPRNLLNRGPKRKIWQVVLVCLQGDGPKCKSGNFRGMS